MKPFHLFLTLMAVAMAIGAAHEFGAVNDAVLTFAMFSPFAAVAINGVLRLFGKGLY